MSIRFERVVDERIERVFAWHERPGAFERLSPPWQPMRLVRETDSLRDGRAVLAVAGLRWIAKHDPDGYDPPSRFTDEVSIDGVRSVPFRFAVARWRHNHLFETSADGRTKVIDHVETPVPARFLRRMFVYRHQQLRDDLAAHQRAAKVLGGRQMTVAVTGASGLVGTALCAFLTTGGHRVIRLVRHPATKPDERQWDPNAPATDLLREVDAVVHLAGESIAGRFTQSHKAEIRDSRIEPTRLLAEVAAGTESKPVFVCASAIGFYGADRGDEVLTEASERGDGFLSDVVADWEAATMPAEDAGNRTVRVRTGIVQSARGGSLKLLRPLFAAGLGGRLGSGQQWTSWVDIDDLVDIYHRAITDESLSGAINAVAPDPVRNEEYTRVLAQVLRRPAFLPVPRFGPKLLLGDQGARELAEANQRVLPQRLLDRGHVFRRPDLVGCLRHQLGKT